MSFLVYIAVLIAALCSVVMGLDWVTSPPPPPTTARMQTTTVEPVRHPVTAGNPAPAKVQSPASRRQAAAAPARPIEDQTVAQSPPGDEAASSPAAPAPSCDIQACTAAYQSFRASDCTYQPYSGPRRACTK
jgi:hypothetical protein